MRPSVLGEALEALELVNIGSLVDCNEVVLPLLVGVLKALVVSVGSLEDCDEVVLSLLVGEKLFNVEVSEFRKPDEVNDTSELGKMLATVLEGGLRVWEV